MSEPVLRATFDRELPSTPRSPKGRRSSTSRTDIAIPDLKHGGPDTDYSLGDISPIKVSYSEMHHHPQPPPPPPHQTAYAPPMTTTQDTAVHPNEMNWPCDSNGNVQSPVSNPFYVIRFAAQAFSQAQITYTLPCLHGVEQCPVHMNSYGQIRQYKPSRKCATLDVKIATMRVEAAICAFGGTLKKPRLRDPKSIFRLKEEESKTHSRRHYDQTLPHRFVLSGSQISWDFEENPPISIPPEDDTSTSGGSRENKARPNDKDESLEARGSNPNATSATRPSPTSLPDSTINNKMKYRCKLCGQLKNNHVCPYRQPLQRSIGVMVYPALNSFTALEPGTVAPPLTNMNNFVSYDSDQTSSGPQTYGDLLEASKSAPTQNAGTGTNHAGHPAAVTPEAHAGASGNFFHSPQSSLSNHSEEGVTQPPHTTTTATAGTVRDVNDDKSRKRLHTRLEEETNEQHPAKRALFVTSFPLRPEHYRSVTQSSRDDCPTAYQYPTIPLTFAERKRLSDTLFVLSKEIPSVTSECAVILREARAKNEWDMAVAELLTQLVVGLFCTEDDLRLEGLQRYLLTLGISC